MGVRQRAARPYDGIGGRRVSGGSHTYMQSKWKCNTSARHSANSILPNPLERSRNQPREEDADAEPTRIHAEETMALREEGLCRGQLKPRPGSSPEDDPFPPEDDPFPLAGNDTGLQQDELLTKRCVHIMMSRRDASSEQRRRHTEHLQASRSRLFGWPQHPGKAVEIWYFSGARHTLRIELRSAVEMSSGVCPTRSKTCALGCKFETQQGLATILHRQQTPAHHCSNNANGLPGVRFTSSLTCALICTVILPEDPATPRLCAAPARGGPPATRMHLLCLCRCSGSADPSGCSGRRRTERQAY